MDKEFGHFTRDQARQAYATLHEVNEGTKDLEQIASESADFAELLVSWAEWYEIPFAHHLIYFALSLGLGDELTQISQAADPQQAFLDLLQSDHVNAVSLEEFDFDRQQLVISLLMALLGQMGAIRLYSQPLSDLLAKVRTGDQDALFRAVTVDRVVVACPSVARQIAIAQMTGDETFMNRLSKAITRTRPARPKPQYDDLRFMLETVVEGVGTRHFTAPQLEDLLQHELELYPNEGDYSLRAFRKLIEKRNRLVGT